MQGIYLTFQSFEKNILKTLLSGFDVSEYHFDVDRFEARKDCFLYPDWEYVDQQAILSSDQAKKRLLESEDNYERIENLALYVRNKTTRKKKIQTFKDLVEGHYDFALKVVDYNTVEIFSTKDDVLKRIMFNAQALEQPYTTIKPYERIDFGTVLGM